MVLTIFTSFQIIQAKHSEGTKNSRENPLMKIELEENRKVRVPGSVFEESFTDMSSEMEAEMEGLYLEEGSSRKDWRNLFTECHEAREIILGRIDLESALACRLVCQEWRETVNCFKKLWTKINKVISLAVVNFCTHDPIYGLKRQTLKKIT